MSPSASVTMFTPAYRSADCRESADSVRLPPFLLVVRELARQAAREVFRGAAHVDPDHGDKAYSSLFRIRVRRLALP